MYNSVYILFVTPCGHSTRTLCTVMYIQCTMLYMRHIQYCTHYACSTNYLVSTATIWTQCAMLCIAVCYAMPCEQYVYHMLYACGIPYRVQVLQFMFTYMYKLSHTSSKEYLYMTICATLYVKTSVNKTQFQLHVCVRMCMCVHVHISHCQWYHSSCLLKFFVLVRPVFWGRETKLMYNFEAGMTLKCGCVVTTLMPQQTVNRLKLCILIMGTTLIVFLHFNGVSFFLFFF